MLLVGRALLVAQIEEAVLLVEIGLIEEKEQPAQDVEIALPLVVGNPSVAEALKDEADAVHLSVGARRPAESPAQAVRPNQIGHHPDVFFHIGAQGRQLAVAHAVVGVELESRPDEDEGQHPVEVEISAQAGDRVVEKPAELVWLIRSTRRSISLEVSSFFDSPRLNRATALAMLNACQWLS